MRFPIFVPIYQAINAMTKFVRVKVIYETCRTSRSQYYSGMLLQYSCIPAQHVVHEVRVGPS